MSEPTDGETKVTTMSRLKLNLEEKPDGSDEDEGEEVSRKKDRGVRPETAPAVSIPHKADEAETERCQ